jgi:hypothetical protein
LNWRSTLALVHANFRLGVLGHERFHYWSLLLSATSGKAGGLKL